MLRSMVTREQFKALVHARTRARSIPPSIAGQRWQREDFAFTPICRAYYGDEFASLLKLPIEDTAGVLAGCLVHSNLDMGRRWAITVPVLAGLEVVACLSCIRHNQRSGVLPFHVMALVVAIVAEFVFVAAGRR
jgi:hypothetical protein